MPNEDENKNDDWEDIIDESNDYESDKMEIQEEENQEVVDAEEAWQDIIDESNDYESDKMEINKEESQEVDEEEKNNVPVSKSRIVLVKKLLENIKENNDKLIELLSGLLTNEDEERIRISQIGRGDLDSTGEDEFDHSADQGKVIEGVFDGENMIGPDGKQYSVPANYASKSKLVEGDILKLVITDRGTFVYKQIGPIERIRAVATLEKDGQGNFLAVADGKKWRVLSASVTYYKGKADDEVVLLIPKTGESKWAAVENIIRDKE